MFSGQVYIWLPEDRYWVRIISPLPANPALQRAPANANHRGQASVCGREQSAPLAKQALRRQWADGQKVVFNVVAVFSTGAKKKGGKLLLSKRMTWGTFLFTFMER